MSDGETAAKPDATDSAKALAEEHGIDLAAVKGTGTEGRIIKADVEALVPAEEAPGKLQGFAALGDRVEALEDRVAALERFSTQ